MSASGREVAHRIFAAEYDDATHSYSESDEERAPNYVVTPTGARVNRVFFVGVLTEVESVSEEVLRGRVADPTGVFVLYAGQYQPDEMAFLEDAEPPLFVAVTGKARTFSPDDSDRVFTSVRPESINAVDADTRDRWTVEAAEDTLARVATARAAMDLDLSGDALTAALREAGVADDLADGIPRAFAAYGTTEHYLATVADLAVDALELVAGEAEEVPGLSVAPDDPGDGTVDPASLAAVEDAVVDLEAGAPAVDGSTPADPEPTSSSAAAEQRESSPAETGAVTDDDEEIVSSGADTEVDDVGAEVDAAGADTGEDDVGIGSEQEEVAAGSEEDVVASASTEPADEAAPSEPGAPVEDEPEDEIGDFEPADSSVDTAEEGVETGADEDDIGEFEPSATATTDDAAADEMPAEDVLDDEERERLEEEYGTFESGTEVPEPGEADIEPEAGPIEPDEIPDEAAGDVTDDAESESEAVDPAASEADDADEETEAESADGTAGEEDKAAGDPDEADEAGDEPDEDVDVDEALMELMGELDDGDGADREALVAAVVDEYGVDPGAVEDAIQDALMAGKCYEPDDAHVKPI